jgi:hypothetical protein
MITRKESLRKAEETSKERDGIVDINLPMPIFITEVYRHNSQGYGTEIANKIIHDSKGKLSPCHPDLGDATSECNLFKDGTKKIYYEIKSSFSRKNGRLGLTHIRDYQNFDYFIVCFVDRTNKFKEYYYLLPKSFICENFKLSAMNNTTITNQENKNVPKTMSLKMEKALNLFGDANILYGTSYKDLMSFLKNDVVHGSMFVNPYKKMMGKTPYTKISVRKSPGKTKVKKF